MLCRVVHQPFLSHGLRTDPSDNNVPQHFACLQSSKVGSRNEEGLLVRERLMLQLESGQVCTVGVRVRRCRLCIESTAAVLLQGRKMDSGNRGAEGTHAHIVPHV